MVIIQIGITVDGVLFEESSKLNRYLLFKYLTLEFINTGVKLNEAHESAKQLIKQHEDNLFGYHGLAWALGLNSIEFFCMYFLQEVFLGDGKADISITHKEIWKELQLLIQGKEVTNKKEFVCPRGFGKTTFISQSSAIWCACYKLKRFIVLCSAVGDTADEFLNNIKIALDGNQKIEKAFGKLYDPRNFTCNSEVLDLANNIRIKSISAASVFRGKNFGNIRPELVILDDYQKDEQVATAEQREKKWRRFNNDVMKSIQRNSCTLIACGTIQHKECFYSRLYNDPAWMHRLERGVLVDNVDTLFNTGLWLEFKKLLDNKKSKTRLEDAKEFYLEHYDEMQFPLLWSEYWECLDYAIDYYSDPISFKQEIQNDVNNIGEKKIRTIITEDAKTIESHDFKKTLLCIDPAGTKTKTNNKDFFAFALCSETENKIKYIRKGEVLQFTKNREYEDYIQHTLYLLREYPEIKYIGIEKNTYGGADSIRIQELINQDKKLSCRHIEILSFPQNKNKDDKINTVIPKINLGQVVFNQEDEEAIKQLYDFAGCKFSIHDDFPDVVAEAVIRIDDIKLKSKKLKTSPLSLIL